MESQLSIAQNIWSKSKLLVKSGVIVLLILILQIPSFYIQDLVADREQRQKEAITEVSSKWAGTQNISGPVLVIPYSDPMRGGEKHLATFLPDQLNIEAKVTPVEKYRGIYKVMLYNSNVKISGNYKGLAIDKLALTADVFHWNEAYLKFHLSDMRGLSEEVQFNWNGQKLTLSPVNRPDSGEEGALVAPVALTGPQDLAGAPFSSDISLSGSGELLFTPAAKNTRVDLQSPWPHPSFTGSALPLTSDIKPDGFTATWKTMSHRQPFPQQWTDGAYRMREYNSVAQAGNVSSAAFGTNLYVPVNDYQKVMRSVKYAALCMLLTFAGFFLIETNNKRSVHPFQYGLIGIALVLFYSLLLSFSEYIGFNYSYLIASVLTIGLITLFVSSILKSGRLSALLSAILMLTYTYVFTLLQLQDYSLLLGSIGLFLTLGIIMYFSRKITW